MADSTKATSSGSAAASSRGTANAPPMQSLQKGPSSTPSISSDGRVDLDNLVKQFEFLSIRVREMEKDKEKPQSSGISIEPAASTKGTTPEGKSTDKDLNRLLKVVGKVRLDPHDEEEFENVVDQWEEACETLDIEFWSLRILSLRLGSEFVRDWIRKNPREDRTWEDYKNALGRYLFPDSDYHLQLEEKIMKQDRTWKISAAIATIIKSGARHQRLLVRWGKSGELKDDKLKQALLNKVPKEEVANCLRVRDFMHISFYDFSRACRGCLHAAEKQKKLAEETKKEETKPTPTPAATVSAVESTNVESEKEQFVCAVPKRKRSIKDESDNSNPWAHVKCYNCNQKGHRVRDCPEPKKRCENCGRVGHKSETCWKSEYPSPMGGTKTTYFRRTKQGVHFDLVDQSTQGNLINAMQLFLEARKLAMERAKVKAKEKKEPSSEKPSKLKVVRKKKKTHKEVGKTKESSDDNDSDDDMVLADHSDESDDADVGAVANIKVKDPVATPHFVNLEILGSCSPAMLDSGAVVSLLPKRLWDEAPSHEKNIVAKCNPGQIPIKGLGGKIKVFLIIEAPIVVQTRQVLQRFFVTDAVSTPLLGVDALHILGISIDFASQKIQFSDDLKEVLQPTHLIPSPLCAVIEAESKPVVNMGEEATEEEKNKVREILEQFSKVWKTPQIGKCTIMKHDVDTGDSTPIQHRPRRLPADKRVLVKQMIEDLQKTGAITPSLSPWAFPIVLVLKKTGEVRMCIDYRSLNSVTKRDVHPLPRITDLVDLLGGATIFSTIDLASGYHQIILTERACEKTAFVTPDGLYEFKVMPFRLINAPSTFQRTMNMAFEKFDKRNKIGIYMDDIVIFTTNSEEHYEVLHDVLERLGKVGLYINIKKSKFMCRRAKYLGFIIESGNKRPDPNQVKALEQLKVPEDVAMVRRFLGLAGYFRQFISHFAIKTEPLTRLLKKTTEWKWEAEQQNAWETIKKELCDKEVRLIIPIEGNMFILDTDASGIAVGAVLMQEDQEGELRSVVYASKTLTEAERKWPIREQEAYAIVWGIIHFASYLKWQPHFIVRTYHQSLAWLWKEEHKRIVRWALLLQEYSFQVEYRKGSKHTHADIFSRDVTTEKGDNEILDRIAISPSVFAIDEMKIRDDDCLPSSNFPTVEEMKKLHESEPPSKLEIKKFKLTKVNNLFVSQGQRIYVPESLRKNIMYHFHIGYNGAHQGIGKAYAKIAKIFWWPDLKNSLQKQQKMCLTCMRRTPAPLHVNQGNLLTSFFNKVVALDTVTIIDRNGIRVTILTMIDHFTKYAQATVLQTGTADELWKSVWHDWCVLFGTPCIFLTDNVMAFTGVNFGQECKKVGIHLQHIQSYRPQSNGMIESFHGMFKKGIETYLRLSNWELSYIVDTVLLAYRSTPHSSTGETPFFALTGYDMSTPLLQQWISRSHGKTRKERYDYLTELRSQMFDVMAQKTVGRHFKNKRNQRELSELESGQLVLYWLTGYERSKLRTHGSLKQRPMWSGPCRVKRKTEGRINTYDIVPIWGKQKVIVKPRDALMPIPMEWNEAEASLATKEMKADRKDGSTISQREKPIDSADLNVNTIDQFVQLLFRETDNNVPMIGMTSEPDDNSQREIKNSSTAETRCTESKQRGSNEQYHCIDTSDVMRWLYNSISDSDIEGTE